MIEIEKCARQMSWEIYRKESHYLEYFEIMRYAQLNEPRKFDAYLSRYELRKKIESTVQTKKVCHKCGQVKCVCKYRKTF